ncbi:MAG TPA: glutamine-hydrolyzing GMP synthase [Actinomycetota bacterium]|jgi:GMP synthase (glutamine-hydrolysing)
MTESRPVLVVDFGAQYAQLIARRVRECHVYSEIVPFDIPIEEIEARRPAGLILSGGPASVYEPGAPAVEPDLFQLGVPVLGICYGQQAMAQVLGGRVEPTGLREYGRTDLEVREPGVLLSDLRGDETVWMSHADTVTAAPDGFEVTARTQSTPVAAMENRDRRLFGVQFHPEVAHTPRGLDVLKRFLYDGCDLLPEWTPTNVIERAVERIRLQVGDGQVLAALSGGVDSAVASLLVYKAIGKNLTCVFVDTGLLRAGEAEQVVETFGKHFQVPLIHVDKSDLFLSKLAGVTDPEQKRLIIGEQFIRVFEEVAREEGKEAGFLVQGTLYPDVIESGSRTAARIKSHHNVGGLPERMDLKLVEPLRELFKDEVRKVGEELGLPEEIVWRQPFPGPGLAVRIVGEVTRDRLEAVRGADEIVQEEVRRAGLAGELWQAFAVLLSIRSVGVMGDGRTYHNPIVIRAVTSEDAMTADWARIPFDVLERMASRIVREVPGVNRVVYDISSKPPSTIEWE